MIKALPFEDHVAKIAPHFSGDTCLSVAGLAQLVEQLTCNQ